jgi:mannose-6-phosphate isomerase-like protein (cupin superfamily)
MPRPATLPNIAQTEEIAPAERLRLDPRREHVLSVLDGVLYVALDDHDVVLTPGDSVTIPCGEPSRTWNGGDEPAHFLHATQGGCPVGLTLAA